MSEGTAPRPYSWLPVLISVLPIIMLTIGGLAFRYTETRMVATAGETLALTAAEVSDKLDRFLIERYGDVLMMARTFSAQPYNREFQSAYVAGMKTAYPDYFSKNKDYQVFGDQAARTIEVPPGPHTVEMLQTLRDAYTKAVISGEGDLVTEFQTAATKVTELAGQK